MTYQIYDFIDERITIPTKNNNNVQRFILITSPFNYRIPRTALNKVLYRAFILPTGHLSIRTVNDT